MLSRSITMLVIENFVLRPESVICPACNTVFATPNVTRLPNMTRDSQVEADLHRVLPDPIIRASFVAVCPSCIYAWWFSAFSSHYILPELVPDTPDIELSKKFAHAVLTGRNNGSHSLDRANLALNGAWCARECHVLAGTTGSAEYQADNTRWLTLAAQELQEALLDESWTGNRNRYSYIMGEILRQLGEFDAALGYFNVVDRRSLLPKQLVEHQKQMAAAHQAQIVTLPPHLVEEIFLPKPVQQPTYTKYEIPPQPAQPAQPTPPQNYGNNQPQAYARPGMPTPPGGAARPGGVQPNQQYEGYINIPQILSA